MYEWRKTDSCQFQRQNGRTYEILSCLGKYHSFMGMAMQRETVAHMVFDHNTIWYIFYGWEIQGYGCFVCSPHDHGMVPWWLNLIFHHFWVEFGINLCTRRNWNVKYVKIRMMCRFDGGKCRDGRWLEMHHHHPSSPLPQEATPNPNPAIISIHPPFFLSKPFNQYHGTHFHQSSLQFGHQMMIFEFDYFASRPSPVVAQQPFVVGSYMPQ